MNKVHVKFGDVINLEKRSPDTGAEASHALIRSEDMEVIRMVLPKSKRIPEHKVEGEITLQCLKGQVELKVNKDTQILSKNDWIALEKGVSHSLEVKEDAILLLTILFTDQK